MEKIGVYPGTFDPITYGHMDIIKKALALVDKLIIAVAMDTAKTPIFSLAERKNLVEGDIKELQKNGHKIEVHEFEGLLVNFAKEHNASLLIRGLRAVSDFEYEFQMSGMNARIAPQIQTVFLPASESTHFIASRFVKEIARLNGDISGFVSKNVKNSLYNYFSCQQLPHKPQKSSSTSNLNELELGYTDSPNTKPNENEEESIIG